MTNDYRFLSDEAIEAHDASLRVQMKGLVAERAKRREEREKVTVTADQHDWNLWTLGRVINSLRMMPDNALSSLTVAWSTTGSMIDAELARRAEAKRATVSSEQWAELLQWKTPEFADILKEHNSGDGPITEGSHPHDINPGHDKPYNFQQGRIREVPKGWSGDEPVSVPEKPDEPPEDFSMFTYDELWHMDEANVQLRRQAITSGDLYAARDFDVAHRVINAEICKRDEK